jgi:SAM-dependent methyltransferase
MRYVHAWRSLVRRALTRVLSLTPNTHLRTDGDRFDVYARGIDGRQEAVDIFKGVWSSALPAHLGLAAGDTPLFNDHRLAWLIDRLGGIRGWEVLELGPLEGGHSYMLQEAGAAKVLAIEACAMSFLKCLLVKDLCQLHRVEFRYADFMAVMESSDKKYDLIVASGVLYHQRDPIACLAKIATRSDRLFIWTHYYSDIWQSDRIRREMFTVVAPAADQEFACPLFRLDYDAYLPGGKYRGGVDDHVHWMRRDDILACLRHHGFSQLEIAFEQQSHPYGPNFAVLAQRPRSEKPLQPLSYKETMLAESGPEPWCIDALRLEGSHLSVSGWAIPRSGAFDQMGFMVNGELVSEPRVGIDREDVGSIYWYYPAADRSGFSWRHPVDKADNQPIHLQYVDMELGTPICPEHDFYALPKDLRGETPAPPLKLVLRTHTGNALDQYFVEGYTLYRTIAQHVEEIIGKPLDAIGRLIDFGCGPGRVARYLLDNAHVELMGLDVDAECIAWCRDHLGAGKFELCPLRPPLALHDESVDGIWAINILLHLREADALSWLREWRRVCRSGSVIAITVASDLAMTRANISFEHYQRVSDLGYLELSRNPDLDEVIDDQDYYKNVFYSHDYLHRNWVTPGLELVRIIPGCIGNHHDLVFLLCV